MSLQTLYEKDFHSWINQSILLLKAHKLEKLDVVHLIEELKGMANKDERELLSRLKQLLCHLLKWDYQADKRSASWLNTIMEQQDQINGMLKNSPSLKNKIDLHKAYSKAVKLAMAQTKMPISTFPAECPYGLKEALNKNVELNINTL